MTPLGGNVHRKNQEIFVDTIESKRMPVGCEHYARKTRARWTGR